MKDKKTKAVMTRVRKRGKQLLDAEQDAYERWLTTRTPEQLSEIAKNVAAYMAEREKKTS
jgi:hypothetical protein